MQDPRFPVGQHDYAMEVDPGDYSRLIEEIEKLPAQVREAVRGLTAAQIDTPYREGGWTVRQVVHHLPDSHMNAYCRIKLALTENEPTIKPYDEARWAELRDVADTPIEVSLNLLEALHRRLALLLRGMSPADFDRGYLHPEHGRTFRMSQVLAMYAWHGRHHAAHITSLRQRQGW